MYYIRGVCPVISLRRLRKLLSSEEYIALQERLLRRLGGHPPANNRAKHKTLHSSYAFVLCGGHDDPRLFHPLTHLVDRLFLLMVGKRTVRVVSEQSDMDEPFVVKELLVYAKQK